MLKEIVITLVGVVSAGIIAMIVAYMDRRQARQIELHRLDPSVPLRPPPNAVRIFLSHNSSRLYNAFAVLWTIGVLYHDLHKEGPVTRVDVVYISMGVGGLFFIAAMTAVGEFTRSFLDFALKTTDIMEHISEAQVHTTSYIAAKEGSAITSKSTQADS